MSGVVAFIRRCLAAGMDSDTALMAAEQFEASPPVSAGAARTRRYRERIASQLSQPSPVTLCDAGDGVLSKQKVSPAPLSKTQPISIPPSPPLGAHGSGTAVPLAEPNGWSEWWEAYPRKVGKADAERKYLKALKAISGPDPPGLLLARLKRVLPTWRLRDPEHIPHPATWLHNRRWEDEIPDESASRPSPKFAAREANFARAFAGAQDAARRRAAG